MRRLLPDTLTLASLAVAALGLIATTVTAVAAAIFICAALDATDGRLARRLGVANAYGRQLDSLADLVAFGVLPLPIFAAYDVPIWLIAAYPAVVAWRIARHNMQPTASIVGIPSNLWAVSAAIGVVAGVETSAPYTVLVALALPLMVSTVVVHHRTT
jgi:CDP-diacylglycerol--serine O-phosphatidyltransferase